MDKIDKHVKQQLQVDSANARVVISCSDECALVAKNLEESGVEVLHQLVEFNQIFALIRREHLQMLESSLGVEYVELDEAVQTQEDPTPTCRLDDD